MIEAMVTGGLVARRKPLTKSTNYPARPAGWIPKRLSTGNIWGLIRYFPSISERIKRLQETGIISKFTIELNTQLVGYPFSAIVRVKPLPGKIHILQQRLIELDNCTQCDKVTGEDCFIARLFLKSIPELDDVLESIVELAETSTAIIKKSPVQRRLPKL